VPASSSKVQAGIDAIQRRDFDEAKKVLSEARSEAPKDPQAAFYLGVALEGSSDRKGAEKAYRDALGLDPKLTDASANLSALLYDEARAADALPVIDDALKFAPKHPDLLVNRALVLQALGNRDEALKAFAQAVEVRPDAPDLRLSYAELLESSGRNSQALEQVRAVKTDDPQLLAAASQLFGKLKAPADCVAVLDRALKSSPTAALQVRRGVCRHEAGDDAGAQADYEAALTLEPRFAAAHYYLGMHFKEKADKKNASLHLQKAIELDPEGGVGKRAKQALDQVKRGH
jgi:Flp pilus assembly protein TadD